MINDDTISTLEARVKMLEAFCKDQVTPNLQQQDRIKELEGLYREQYFKQHRMQEMIDELMQAMERARIPRFPH